MDLSADSVVFFKPVWLLLSAIAVITINLAGCVAITDHNEPRLGCTSSSDIPDSVQIVSGTPNVVLDGIGWVAGIPSKISLWDRRADNHQVSPETVAEVARHLRSHEMNSVLVRVNQYDPTGEWVRLCRNKNLPLGWRLTGGTFETLKYTLLPETATKRENSTL